MSIKTFLKQRAVTVAVGGSYTLANWFDPQGKPRTFACRTSRVSPFRMMVDVPVVGKIGDQISSYFSDFGKLEGHISDIKPGGFLFELAMDKSMREKMAGELSWLKMNRRTSASATPGCAGIIPASPHSALTFADGSIHSCFVIDMSVSGAAISASVQLQIGRPARGRKSICRVCRDLPMVCVHFVEPQSRIELERRITRPPPPWAAPTVRRLRRAPMMKGWHRSCGSECRAPRSMTPV